MRTRVPQRLATHSCHKQWNQDINLDRWFQSCSLFPNILLSPAPKRKPCLFTHLPLLCSTSKWPRNPLLLISSVRLQPFPSVSQGKGTFHSPFQADMLRLLVLSGALQVKRTATMWLYRVALRPEQPGFPVLVLRSGGSQSGFHI